MTKTLLVGAVLCAMALVILAIRPDFDLAAAALFYRSPNHFVADTPLGNVVRYIAWFAPFVLLGGLVLTSLAAFFGVWPKKLAPSPRGLAVIVLSFALSPGLFVYATFKPLAHRPRPHSVIEFGGGDQFRPFTTFDGACTHSCSFPSGETAGALWTLAPASLLPPPWRVAAMSAALVFGASTGLLRMAFGGHFLSDVLGAAFVTFVSILVAWHRFGVWRNTRQGPVSLR